MVLRMALECPSVANGEPRSITWVMLYCLDKFGRLDSPSHPWSSVRSVGRSMRLFLNQSNDWWRRLAFRKFEGPPRKIYYLRPRNWLTALGGHRKEPGRGSWPKLAMMPPNYPLSKLSPSCLRLQLPSCIMKIGASLLLLACWVNLKLAFCENTQTILCSLNSTQTKAPSVLDPKYRPSGYYDVIINDQDGEFPRLLDAYLQRNPQLKVDKNNKQVALDLFVINIYISKN